MDIIVFGTIEYPRVMRLRAVPSFCQPWVFGGALLCNWRPSQLFPLVVPTQPILPSVEEKLDPRWTLLYEAYWMIVKRLKVHKNQPKYSCMSFNMQSAILGVVTETEGAGENCHPSGGVIFSSSFPTLPP